MASRKKPPLTDLQRLILDLDEIKVGNLKTRGKQVHSEDIERYLKASPKQGLRFARAAEKRAEKAQHGQQDLWWWEIECEKQLYQALGEIYENLLAGIPLTAFPRLRDKQGEIVVSRLMGMSEWIIQMRKLRQKKRRTS